MLRPRSQPAEDVSEDGVRPEDLVLEQHREEHGDHAHANEEAQDIAELLLGCHVAPIEGAVEPTARGRFRLRPTTRGRFDFEDAVCIGVFRHGAEGSGHALGLKGNQAEDDGKAGERDEPGSEGERKALGHELALGACNVYEVIGRLNRGGVERLAADRDVVVVASADLALLEPDLSGLFALNRSVGIVGDGAIGLAHREREAAGSRFHAVEHVIDLHASEQLLEPSGMNHDLYESVGIARIVVGCHADV